MDDADFALRKKVKKKRRFSYLFSEIKRYVSLFYLFTSFFDDIHIGELEVDRS